MAELSVETVKAIITYANKNVNLEICYSQSTPRIDQLQTYHSSIEKQPNFGKYAFLRRWLYVIPVFAPRLLPNYRPRVGKSGLKATSPVMSMFSWPWKRQIAILIFVQLLNLFCASCKACTRKAKIQRAGVSTRHAFSWLTVGTLFGCRRVLIGIQCLYYL